MSRPKVSWFEHESGDLVGGVAKNLHAVKVAVTVHNVTPSVQIAGPYCVQEGQVFNAGPYAGDVTETGTGQVGC